MHLHVLELPQGNQNSKHEKRSGFDPGHIHAMDIVLSGGVNRVSKIAKRLHRFVNTPWGLTGAAGYNNIRPVCGRRS
jgi:hypothetical protein